MSTLHEHTLNRIVPAMASGFVIQTTYGDLIIESGPLAELMACLLQMHAQRELNRSQANQGAQGLPVGEARVVGASCMASHSARQASLQALRGQLANLRPSQPMPACAGQQPAQADSHTPAFADGVPAPHTHCAAPCVPCAGFESQPPAPQSQPAQMGGLS